MNIAKVESYDCAEGYCGVTILTPESYNNKILSSISLAVGDPPSDLLAPLAHVKSGSTVSVEIYGTASELSRYTVWVAYASPGECADHALIEIGEHNK
ncbi:MAG: hypothetical protein DHS20C09_11990 [marine bacterium B5-7]|nr:MAG: hypothetical protein DHS20C09_11990 [marine bacterium B5-7]